MLKQRLSESYVGEIGGTGRAEEIKRVWKKAELWTMISHCPAVSPRI